MRIVSWTLFALLLVGAFMSTFNMKLASCARYPETVYINSDGSVTPSSAPISSIDNVTYTFTGNISSPAYGDGIIVNRNNIIVCGDGYTMQGEYGTGICLSEVCNVTIENINIGGFVFGIFLDSSSRNNTISGNNVVANGNGIYLGSSSNNIISGNTATANDYGIHLFSSSNNLVSENNATANNIGIGIEPSSNNNTVNKNIVTTNVDEGIEIEFSSNNNAISGNTATANGDGIHVDWSSNNNIISGNNATANSYYGIFVGTSSNNIISGNNATANSIGIQLFSSSNNTVSSNNAIANIEALLVSLSSGISLVDGSSNNILKGNNVTANTIGIQLHSSSNNTISGNNAKANAYAITLVSSSNGTIYNNNFVGNGVQASVELASSGNVWDDGYPSGGNFWSDYNGSDSHSGSYQNVTGGDGIGDTSYDIDASNRDGYPLMGAFSNFNAAEGVNVQVVSNSTVSDFSFNGTAILFNVSGTKGTTGFCNLHLPTTLLDGTLSVFVNGTQIEYNLLPISNSTDSYLYFTYGHSTEQIIVMPEFPDSLVLSMFILTSLLALAVHKKRHNHS